MKQYLTPEAALLNLASEDLLTTSPLFDELNPSGKGDLIDYEDLL